MKLSKVYHIFSASFLFFLLVFAHIALAETSALSNRVARETLRLGDRKSDVLVLQKTLNLDARTQIADIGPGSKGSETDYFGIKTLAAVERFQLIHEKEVLRPVGLTRPTGIVGPLTWSALNSILAVSTSSPVGVSIPTGQKVPRIFRITPANPMRGGTVAIAGVYFEKNSAVSLDGVRLSSVVVDNTESISLRLPGDVQAGAHELSVSNSSGKSLGFSFSVSNSSADPKKDVARVSAPVITSITPSSGARGTAVVIKGRNFDLEDNTIYVGYDVLRGVPAGNNGREIKIVLNPPFGTRPTSTKYSVPLWIYVQTVAGTSSEAIFNVTF